ncbi:hypothetical protein [Pseudogemmobacter humi]|uniref:EF hand n=1 Tax=Pseudogemmobacter humi TaxID=2483812 RepID=A0A3P5WTG3_9RHOB|nr:hypothetical protein [Pseudogemmobacter humi]VDC22480.1 EF hand [Pseudogemmobacter humi]
MAKLISLTLGLGLIAGAALAQESTTAPAENGTAEQPGIAGGHSQAAYIAGYDQDGDGKVSLDELIEVRTARFRGADTDGSGELNEAEYVAEFEGRLRQQYADQGRDTSEERFANSLKQAGVRFAVLDRDRNNSLSLEEDLESARKTFARNDTDGDGFVTAADPKPVRENDDQNAAQDGEKKEEKAD